MSVHVATKTDANDWAQLRYELWPNSSLSEHAADIAAVLARQDETLNLIAVSEDGMAIGFAEASLRHDYVNGCNSLPVAFLEGIYVRPEQRRMGFARQLVAAVEAWARQQKCSELASDADIANQTSHLMHQALGFVETQRWFIFARGCPWRETSERADGRRGHCSLACLEASYHQQHRRTSVCR